MRIVNSFTVPLPGPEAWPMLLDIPAIAPCMPGAKLLSAEDNKFAGEIAVRLGPVLLNFKGNAEIVQRDDEAHVAVVKAEGRDTKGRGGANAEINFKLVELGQESRVDLVTELSMTGMVAQYGRGSGMITDLSEHLLGEFSRNLEGMLKHRQTERSSGETAGPPSVEAAGDSPVTEAMPAAAPLSAFDLAAVVIKGFFRRLFGRRSSVGG